MLEVKRGVLQRFNRVARDEIVGGEGRDVSAKVRVVKSLNVGFAEANFGDIEIHLIGSPHESI